MSADLNTICPIPDDLISPGETDPTAHVKWTGPGTLKLGDTPPVDYPEADDENAHNAMLAERDALKARVKELENDLKNARRDIQYLNGKLITAQNVMTEALATMRQNIIDFEKINGDGAFNLALKDSRGMFAKLKAVRTLAENAAQEAKP